MCLKALKIDTCLRPSNLCAAFRHSKCGRLKLKICALILRGGKSLRICLQAVAGRCKRFRLQISFDLLAQRASERANKRTPESMQQVFAIFLALLQKPSRSQILRYHKLCSSLSWLKFIIVLDAVFFLCNYKLRIRHG